MFEGIIDAENMKWLDEFRKEHRYEIKKYGNNPTVVIHGESHGNTRPLQEERNEQEELVRKLRPKYVLIETLHALTYDPKNNYIGFREDAITGGKDIEFCKIDDDYKKISDKYSVQLIGCDFSLEEMDVLDKNLGLPVSYTESVMNSRNNEREKKMGEVIISFSKKSLKPLVAITGHKHAMESSKIHCTLKGKVDYITIWQDS